MKKRIMALAMALCMTAMLLAGCGDASSGSTSASGGDSGQASSGVSGSATPSGKDSVTIITATEPVNYDMISQVSSQTDTIVLNNIYDGLVYITPEGEYLPALATEWVMADDGLSYTFTLREGVTFHNGYPFTAEDVKFSLEGVNERNNGSSLFANFTEAEIVDEYTIVLHLSSPYAAFLTGIASRDGYVQSKQLYEEIGAEGYAAEPVGTGAYRFVSRVSGDTVTLEGYEDYWAGAPSIKTVYIKTISEVNTQMISLESGEADVLLSPALSSVLQLSESGPVTWNYTDAASRTTLNLKCSEGYLANNKDFRKALQYAIDKEDILLGAMEGYGSIIDIDMSPIYTGHPSTYDAPPEYDPEKAKEYLAASGYNGEEFQILCLSGTTSEIVTQIIQSQLIAIGINCTVGAYDTSTFSGLTTSGDFMAYVRTSQSSVIDAEALYAFFRLPAYMPDDYPEHEWIDEKLREGRAIPNGPEREAIYQEVVDFITEEGLQVPLYADINIVAFNKDLNGVEPHPVNIYRIFEWNWA